MEPYWTDGQVTLHLGDCVEVLAAMETASVDAVVTDPPYGLEFMGKEWDRFSGDVTDRDFKGFVLSQQRTRNVKCPECGRWAYDHPGRLCECCGIRRAQGSAFQRWCEAWATEALRVLKPGGHLLAFGGTRTYHRLACGIEDAGFEVRDSMHWVFAQGFPKSLSVGMDARFCQCDLGESDRGDGDLLGVRDRVSDVSRMAQESEVSDLLSAVQRAGSGSRLGEARTQGFGGQEDEADAAVWIGQPGLEGRRDTQAAKGELQGCPLRPLPTGVPSDGTGGRLHHGAPARDGSVGRPDADADRGRQPQGPRPVEQRQVESGVVSDERGSQARGSRPLCGRCGKPAAPRGLGTALKPAHEPIIVARKPLAGTVAHNVLTYGVGALNIDRCRTATSDSLSGGASTKGSASHADGWDRPWKNNPEAVAAHSARAAANVEHAQQVGRWPPNILLGPEAAAELDRQSGASVSRTGKPRSSSAPGEGYGMTHTGAEYDDRGGASRFFPRFAYGPRDHVFFPVESGACEQLGDVSTKAASTSAGRRTASSDASSLTGGSGSRPMAPSQTATRSTTETTISSTMTSPISCASPPSGTTTTTRDSASSTDGLTVSNSGGVSDAGNGSRSPNTTSGEPEPGRDIASPASALTGESGSADVVMSSTRSDGTGEREGSARNFPVFRYEAKAGSAERPRGEDGTAHPTVKPVDLMAWLVRLVTPPGGLVLDPFAGSGTTAEACIVEGFRCVLVEKDPAYAELIRTRLRKDIQPTMFGAAS